MFEIVLFLYHLSLACAGFVIGTTLMIYLISKYNHGNIPEYGRIIRMFNKRLMVKHKEFGLSYLDSTNQWLFNIRLMGELDKLSSQLFPELLYFNDRIIEKCIDVAIVALLIASKNIEENR